MTYGPFSLIGATDARTTFWLRYDLGAADKIVWQASIDGLNWYGYQTGNGNNGAFQQVTFDLKAVPTIGNLCGRATVYIRFYCESDSVESYNDGPFLDDIVIERYGEPAPPPPVITSISLSSASAGTATAVTINGSNFGATRGSSTVNFFYKSGQPTIPATVYSSWTDTSITCQVPVGVVGGYLASAGSGPVTVTTSGGTSGGYTLAVPFGYDGRKWAGAHPSIPYRVNENTTDCTGEGTAVQAAANTWNYAGANFAFSYAGATTATVASSNSVNEIMWGTCDPGVIAATYLWNDNVTMTIVERDIVFNDPDFVWDTSGAPSASQMDVQTIAVHELGHWLCLRDLYGNIGDGMNDGGKIMYGFGGNGTVKRNLATADRDGIRWIYGLAPESPVLTNIEVTTLSYTENAAATAITASITVSDADSTNMTSGSVQITTNYQSGQDVLSYTQVGSIAGTWNSGTGTLSLSGIDTKANYQLALRAVKYANTSDNPSTLTRTVTFKVNDGTADSNTQTRNVSVTAVNDAPTLTTVSPLSGATEDTAFTISFATLGAASNTNDVDGGSLQFRIEGVSSGVLTKGGTAVVPGTTLLGAGESLVWTPAANANGTLNAFTVRAWDGSLASATAVQVQVQVAAVNDAPTLAVLSNITTNEDAGVQTLTLSGIAAGASESQTLTVTATSANPGLIPNPSVTYTSPNATGTLTFTPVANASGSALISVVVQDNGGTNNGGVDAVTRTFTVTVNAVNDAPTLAVLSNITTNEDAGVQTVALSGIAAGAGESQTLTVTATSGNPALIPNPSVTYTSPNATGTLTFTPVANASGSALISVVVQDNGGTNNGGVDAVTRTFTVTVNAVNDAPTLAVLSNITTNEDAGLQTVALNGISAGGGESQTLTVTASSGNPALIPNPAVTYTSPSAAGTLTFTPVTNASGSALISVVVRDNGGTNYGGVDAVTNMFTVTVNAVNDPPTLAALSNITTNEDAGLQTVALNGISAGGGESQTLTVTASSGNPALIPNPAVTYTSPSAAGTLTFTPVTNASGSALISVVVRDNGGTNYGGVDAVTNTFTVTVNAVNDAPTLAALSNITTYEDAGAQMVTLSGISAGAGESQTLTVTATSGNLGLIPNPSVTYTSPNATGTLTFTPVANAGGSALISVVVRDNGGTNYGGVNAVTNTFTVTVNAVNDAPVAVNDLYSVTKNATLALSAPGVLANDTDVEGNALTAVLASGPAHGTLTLTNNGGFTYRPGNNYVGPDSFTYRANDGLTNSAVATVNITVLTTNTPPVASDDSYTMAQDSTLTIPATGVLSNDTDVDADPLTAVLVSTTTHGILTLTNNGGFTYIPTANYTGTDAFTYRANDGITNSAVATVTITITNVNRLVTVAGAVTYYDLLKPVPGMIMSLTGGTNLSSQTASNGNYSFSVNAGGNYAVAPSKSDDNPPANGVSTVDISLIRRHILNIVSLDSPYKLLAADVSGSGSVSTLDISLLRKVILGTTNVFPAGLWRCVRSDHVFADPQNPWNAPASRNYTNLASSVPGENYVAIKLGDVNNSWTAPAGLSSLQAGAAEGKEGPAGLAPEVTLQVSRHAAQPGETVTAQVTANAFREVTSAQFTLQWDPAVLRYVASGGYGLNGLAASSFSTDFATGGRLTFSWDDLQAQSATLPDGTVIFTVTFQVTGNAGDVSPLILTDAPTALEVAVNCAVARVRTIDGEVSIVQPSQPSLFNPIHTGQEFRVSVPTLRGQRYALEFKDALPGSTWNSLPAVEGTGAVMQLVDPGATTPVRFYRVRVEQP